VTLKKGLQIAAVRYGLGRWLALTGLDQHDFAREIACMRRIFREAARMMQVQFHRPATVDEPPALVADRVPGKSIEAFVVGLQVETQRMTRRVRCGEIKGCPNDGAAGGSVAAEQQVKESIAVHQARITEKAGRRRLHVGKALEMRRAR
jgi:hypothetical protein